MAADGNIGRSRKSLVLVWVKDFDERHGADFDRDRGGIGNTRGVGDGVGKEVGAIAVWKGRIDDIRLVLTDPRLAEIVLHLSGFADPQRSGIGSAVGVVGQDQEDCWRAVLQNRVDIVGGDDGIGGTLDLECHGRRNAFEIIRVGGHSRDKMSATGRITPNDLVRTGVRLTD